jgi:Ni,Fe-hydrogenase I large subunit
MEWLMENWAAVIFLATTILAVVKTILLLLGKKKAAKAIEEFKKILHQTFGNVEKLKAKWKESGAEDKYGHIGEIFAAINKEESIDKVLETAYNQWLKEQDKRLDKSDGKTDGNSSGDKGVASDTSKDKPEGSRG